MQSKIIEKILNGDNKALNKIIEIVRNNAVFQEVMSDFKEEFFIDDNIHGISHNERVALLACYIGIQEGLNDEELRLVLEATKYHDIGRGFEGNHGQYSAIIIDRNKEHIFPNLSDDEINTIKALCHGHSVDDNKYIEIAKLYGIENIEKFKRLLDIVKDADALDRVRLPRFGQLEEKYLRTETSKRIIDFSKELFRKYRDIQQELPKEDSREHDVMSNYQVNTGLRSQLLFDGENYYLVRSLNKVDIESFDKENGIIPKIDNKGGYTAQDVMAQIRMQHRKTNLISMSEDPNIVLTYDKSNLHRFVLIKLSKDEIEDSKKVFSAGEYLLGVMDYQIEMQAQNAPLKVRQILERVDNASSIEEIIKTINGADRQVATSLVESKQQYLSEAEQLEQSKKIAKCKVLNYYGLMRGITHDEKGKLIDISGFTQIMRNGYSSSEWLYSGKIEQEKLIDIPKILVDALALVKQAEFQGKDKEILNRVEIEILSLVSSGAKIDQDKYQLEYSAQSKLKSDLTIDKAFEITGGQISYRDTNMQMIAIRSVAEMTLNKREIIRLLQERLPNINIDELLADTYCINQEMTTRQNNRGSQIGKNINFIISDYGYDLDDEVSTQILQSIENLSDEQLSNIILKGVDAQEISSLLTKTRENDERIQSFKSKSLDSKYIAEAIVEGYSWRKDGNSLTIKEEELLANKLLLNVVDASQLHALYEAIIKIQIGRNKFTQNEIFAIIINIAIDGKIGDISWKELLEKDRKDVQNILLDSKEQLQTSVLPISMDLLAGRGKEINKLKKELIDLGIDKDFIDSKDIKNVYVAKQIVEGYDFGREIAKKEKAALVKAVLNHSFLDKENSSYLTTLIRNMEQIGLNTQEIYGMIINLGVNRNVIKESEYNYTKLLGNQNNTCQTIMQYKDNIQTEVTITTILTALSENLNKSEQEEIKSELIELGIDKDFIDSKNIKNVYIAKKIVEVYDFGREITKNEKKALIESILNPLVLGGNENILYISTLLQNMGELRLTQQELYGAMINLSINSSFFDRGGYSYTALLMNQNNSCHTIQQYKGEIPTSITKIDILKALSNNVNDQESKNIQEYFIKLGLSKEFIEEKDISNVFLVKQIIEEYEFGEKITDEIKCSLAYSLLHRKALNKGSHTYLYSLMKNLESIGLSEQQIYGTIINLGIDGYILEKENFSFSRLLDSGGKLCQLLASYKEQIPTEVSKLSRIRAIQNNDSISSPEKIREEFIDLGADEEIINSTYLPNLYAVKQIIEGYNFSKELSKDEKIAILQSILKNDSRLLYRPFLRSLIQNLEQAGLSEQQIYGMIINLGVTGNVLNERGYSYTDLLTNKNNACQTIMQYKADIETEVTATTILTALSDNIRENQYKEIKDELIEMGIDEDFIESKNKRNVYVAKKIVDRYNWGRDFTNEEKRAIIQSILSPSILDRKASLVYLVRDMELMGLDEQEVYGMVINLSINGRVLEETGYYYSTLLGNNNNSRQTISKYKDKIQTKVTEGTILEALSNNIRENEQEIIKSRFLGLGINEEFLNYIAMKNLYIAERILTEYDFKRNLSSEEKGAVLLSILKNGKLKKSASLGTLIKYMEQTGLNLQEIYGMIINLSINGRIIDVAGYTYSNLLDNKNNVCQTIAQYKNEIQTEVTKETIQRAVKEVNKKKTIKGKDIVQASMELVVTGNGGSEMCEQVQADYQKLLDQSLQKEGSEQDVPN